MSQVGSFFFLFSYSSFCSTCFELLGGKKSKISCDRPHKIKKRKKKKSHPVIVSFLLMSSNLKKTSHQEICSRIPYNSYCNRLYQIAENSALQGSIIYLVFK